MERKALILTFFFLSLCLYSQCYQAVKTNQSNNNGCTIALQTDGSLWSWGYNESGALGTGTSTVPFVYFSKSQIGTSTDWSSKFSVNSHVLALKNDGTLWVWGSNFYGQCGNGTSNNNVLEPQQLGNDVWLNVAAGSTYSLAVKSDGTLWAWGSNLHGQLGNGTVISSTIPIQIGASTNWEKVFSNDRTSYAIKTDGTLWSWGLNSFGLLGRTTGTFNIPSQIGTSDN